jgi:hypothetical protein
MILAMAGCYESYSSGQGRITQEKMEKIFALAQAHGFRPAPLYRGKNLITDEALNTFLRNIYQQ